jgi:hypothetical protein
MPVVMVAADRFHAEKLEALVVASGCQFTIDEARSQLLVIHGRSILDTMGLADLLVEHRSNFRHPPKPQRSRPPCVQEQPPVYEQPPLFS